jgi:hypothetical protein
MLGSFVAIILNMEVSALPFASEGKLISYALSTSIILLSPYVVFFGSK